MPKVMVSMKKTDDIELKKTLVKELTDVIEKHLKVPRTGVQIFLKEYLPENLGAGGVLLIDQPQSPFLQVRMLKTADEKLKRAVINDITAVAEKAFNSKKVSVLVEEDLVENLGGSGAPPASFHKA